MREIIYIFNCGCPVDQDTAQKYSEMPSPVRAALRKLRPGIKYAKHQRYCQVHGEPMKYRRCWCVECGTQIDYEITGGSVPERCVKCAEVRNRAQRNAASKRQREQCKTEKFEAKNPERQPRVNIQRGDYCRNCAGCEASGKINGSQSACLRCGEFVPWFRGVDPVEIAEIMGVRV